MRISKCVIVALCHTIFSLARPSGVSPQFPPDSPDLLPADCPRLLLPVTLPLLPSTSLPTSTYIYLPLPSISILPPRPCANHPASLRDAVANWLVCNLSSPPNTVRPLTNLSCSLTCRTRKLKCTSPPESGNQTNSDRRRAKTAVFAVPQGRARMSTQRRRRFPASAECVHE